MSRAASPLLINKSSLPLRLQRGDARDAYGSASADWRLASSSASNSFFDNLPTGVFGREARISIAVGIS